MEKFQAWLEKVLVPIGTKLGGNKYLNILQRSFIATLPLTISASIALIISYFPFIEQVVPEDVMGNIIMFLDAVSTATLSLIALYLAGFIGYNFAKDEGHDPLLGRLSREWRSIVERSGVELDEREGDAELIAQGVVDVIGLNVYMPERIQAGGPLTAGEWLRDVLLTGESPDAIGGGTGSAATASEAFLISRSYVWPEAQMNRDRGWETYPQVMYDSVMDIARRYPASEIRITENGMGVHDEARFRGPDGMIDDSYRIDYLRDHVTWLGRAIDDGANVTGYNMWSFVDLWSPSNQFKNCYGLIEFDRATGDIRRKASADWFETLTRANTLEL